MQFARTEQRKHHPQGETLIFSFGSSGDSDVVLNVDCFPEVLIGNVSEMQAAQIATPDKEERKTNKNALKEQARALKEATRQVRLT